MSYRIPDFPLALNVWRSGNVTTNPPDLVTTCNLTPGKRVTTQWVIIPTLAANPAIWIQLLLAAGTDVRGWNDSVGPDTVECPAGSGRYYEVQLVDDLGKGFPNEHRFAFVSQLPGWPSPIP